MVEVKEKYKSSSILIEYEDCMILYIPSSHDAVIVWGKTISNHILYYYHMAHTVQHIRNQTSVVVASLLCERSNIHIVHTYCDFRKNRVEFLKSNMLYMHRSYTRIQVILYIHTNTNVQNSRNRIWQQK